MSRKTVPRCFVVGVGMTKFEKPMTRKWDYPDMVRESGTRALQDAKVSYENVDVAIASYCYGEPTAGQRAIYELGLSGVPIFNTNNNCSSASTALMMAKMFIQSRQFNCALAVGFEKMERGLTTKYDDRVNPCQRHFDHMLKLGATPGLVMPRLSKMTSNVIKLYAYAAREHSSLHGTTDSQYIKISYKNHRQSVNNPYACLQKAYPVEAVAKSRVLCEPITMAMASPTADGSAAAIICNEEFMLRNGLQDNAVEIVAQQMVTDLPSSFESRFSNLSGAGMAKKAASFCYQTSTLCPNDIDVLEVHDCFSCNELFMYEALGLCPEGKGGELIDKGKWITNRNGGDLYLLGDRWVVNPSGGLESKGHPIGATGLAQCAELNWQLRNLAGKRQVDDARIGMQHNFGIGGAAVVTIYKKYNAAEELSKSKL